MTLLLVSPKVWGKYLFDMFPDKGAMQSVEVSAQERNDIKTDIGTELDRMLPSYPTTSYE